MVDTIEFSDQPAHVLKDLVADADTIRVIPLLRSRFSASGAMLGTGRAWIAAAFLVIVSATAAGLWLDHTAAQADSDRLQRGADAIARNIESEIRMLSMVATGAEALFSGAQNAEDLASMMTGVDTSILSSLVALVSYPVTEEGVSEGELVAGIRTWEDIVVPDLALPKDELDRILSVNPAHISASYTEAGKTGVRMVALLPVEDGAQARLTGAIFLIDRMLAQAVAAVGDGEYVATLLDTRFDDLIVTSTGPANGDISVRMAPTGLAGLLDVVVAPGSTFHYSRTIWVPLVSVVVGLTVALILLALAAMTKARAKEMERRLQEAQSQHESRDRFLAAVSHELRTPLTVVMGVASEMNSQWDALATEEREEFLNMIVEQAEEAANIVEDLLVAARSEYGNVKIAMVETGLQRHLEYATESIPPSRRARFRMATEDPVIYADSTRVRQILRNLLQNAVRHGGPNIAVGVAQRDGMIQVSVVDDGRGLAVNECERIFEPYSQARGSVQGSVEGVGIGLYVSRLLARLMGGDLVYVRTDGLTEFRLTLRAQDSVDSVPHEPVSIDSDGHESVLVP